MAPNNEPMVTVAVRWEGPPQQSCTALAAHGYPAVCDSETEYELPRAFARQLAASHQGWRLPAGELAAIAAEAATDPEQMTVKQLDEKYGELDGYPVKANRADKVAFVVADFEEREQ
ncbi:MAG: hypothetical protein ACJ76I_11860 [Gaiellaceae bacterium]